MINVEFLYFFIPVFMGLYAVCGKKLRPLICVVASAYFVCLTNLLGLVPMAVSVVVGYVFGRLTDSAKQKEKNGTARFCMTIAVIIETGIYGVFVCSNYMPTDIVSGYTGGENNLHFFTAFGVAIYTLHCISYCIDIFRGKYKSEHNFLIVAQYISFFPVLTAGPIVRFNEVSEQLKNPTLSTEKMYNGIKEFLIGLGEKLLLAGGAFEIWSKVRKIDIMSISAPTAWIGIIAFSFSFYYELMGFSRMGRGISMMMGITLPENFDKPFMTGGFMEQTRRFNMTLTKWMDEYVFHSIKPYSHKVRRLSLPVTVLTAVISATWYGFGFRTTIWMLYIVLFVGIELMIRKKYVKLPYAIRLVIMNFLYLVGLPLLAMPKPYRAFEYILAMFGANDTSGDVASIYLIKTGGFLLVVCTLCATNIFKVITQKISNKNETVLNIVTPVWEIALMFLCTAALVSEKSGYLSFLF